MRSHKSNLKSSFFWWKSRVKSHAVNNTNTKTICPKLKGPFWIPSPSGMLCVHNSMPLPSSYIQREKET